MPTLAKVVQLFRGQKQAVPYMKKTIDTAIYKSRLNEQVNVSVLGLANDEQADTKHHGGPDKAICVYLEESYSYWQSYKERNIAFGSFGENVIFSQLTEDEVCIGDCYKIGNLLVQVSQPRQPCFKLGIRNDWAEMTVIARNSGYTGFYLRVLEEGVLEPEAEVKLISREPLLFSIKEANTLLYTDADSQDETKIHKIKQLIELDTLAEAFKKDLIKKLNKLQG